MTKTQEELEAIINNSPLFSIDREKDGTLWQLEKMKLFEAAYWLSAYLKDASTVSHEGPKSTRNIKYGDIACECVINCIDKYNPKLGSFINYFKSALTHEIKNDPHHNLEKNPGGISIPHESEIRLVMAFRKILAKTGKPIDDEAAYQFIADETSLSVRQVKKYIRESLLLDAKPLPSYEENDSAHEADEEPDSPIETPELKNGISSIETVDEKNEYQRKKIIQVLNIIQSVFSSEKFRSPSKRTLAKAVLTNDYAPFLLSNSLEPTDRAKYIFVDDDVLNEYRKTKKGKTDIDLAQGFGYKDGSIVSTILKKYKEALRILK
ncbi:hypothetical protein FACS1894140_5000 [Spirochaetia bacterium]|nr:hypothetical protein FACS1894140_5000 [Spirochaetia bacterium]